MVDGWMDGELGGGFDRGLTHTQIPNIVGNTVIVKQAPQTFPCAERFTRAFEAAGLPKHVFQHLHAPHDVAEAVIKNPLVQFVQFTG